MATSKLTLIGMYQWSKLNNDDLFTNLTVPTGIDKDKLISTILMNGAEFEVLYGDFEFMKFLIGKWSDKWQNTMKKWIDALSIEYNPLENYDRMEDWTDGKKTSELNSASSTSSGSGSNEDKKSAYDASTYQPFIKSETSSAGNNQSTGLSSGNEEGTHTGRTHGNIGVTTSQQMLQAELDIARFNLYDEISNLFLTEMVVYTY